MMEAWGGNGSSRAVRRFGSWVWGVRGRRAERSRDEGQGGCMGLLDPHVCLECVGAAESLGSDWRWEI